MPDKTYSEERLAEFERRIEDAKDAIHGPYGGENWLIQAVGALVQDKLFELHLLAAREKAVEE